jgi:hypothetical protein
MKLCRILSFSMGMGEEVSPTETQSGKFQLPTLFNATVNADTFR